MALRTKRGGELPPGAVAVSQKEALEYQKKFISTWPSETDVLFLKYGHFMSGATTFVSSGAIMKFFKQFFNIRLPTVLYFSYIGSGVLPSIFSCVVTEKYLTSNILLMKMNCPVCEELKFGLGQLYISVVYPAIFGQFIFGVRAQAAGLYHFPDIKTHATDFWKETFTVFKKSAKVLKFVALGQLAWILFLPYMQNKELLNVMNKAKAKEATFNENLDKFSGLEDKLY